MVLSPPLPGRARTTEAEAKRARMVFWKSMLAVVLGGASVANEVQSGSVPVLESVDADDSLRVEMLLALYNSLDPCSLLSSSIRALCRARMRHHERLAQHYQP